MISMGLEINQEFELSRFGLSGAHLYGTDDAMALRGGTPPLHTHTFFFKGSSSL